MIQIMVDFLQCIWTAAPIPLLSAVFRGRRAARLAGLVRQASEYDQSISSFFADNDPDMAIYQKAAAIFGDDNFVFVVYDDPDLLTPGGHGSRGRTGCGARWRPCVLASSGSNRLTQMPLVWAIDDALLALDKLARVCPQPGHEGSQADREERRSEIKLDDGRRRRALGRTPAQLAGAQGPPGPAPALSGHADRSNRQDRRRVARLKKTHQHNVIETTAALRRICRSTSRHGTGLASRPWLDRRCSWPTAFAAIEVDGRRLAVVGMVLIGVVTLSAVHSLWWAIVPMLAGWVIWLATEAMLSDLSHQAVALGRSARSRKSSC